MLLERYYEISQAPDIAALEARLIRFAQALEFAHVNAVLVIDPPGPGERASFIAIGNTPEPYRESQRDPTASARDPVNRRLRTMSVPFIYDQQLYATAGAGDLWETQAAFGYKTGVAVALHLPDYRHFLLGVDRDVSLPREEGRLSRVMADLQLLAVHAQSAASRLLAPDDEGGPAPELTPREVEVLRWTMEGKTAWSVGSILGVSEATVNFHLRNVFRKLGAASKHQAVLKALKLRLI
ncbi:MAG: autoinducer binding domain-containing protein [Rubrivivax sp.]|nr:autoinducer binding domain-containing protein [Rubrivivax sp.]